MFNFTNCSIEKGIAFPIQCIHFLRHIRPRTPPWEIYRTAAGSASWDSHPRMVLMWLPSLLETVTGQKYHCTLLLFIAHGSSRLPSGTHFSLFSTGSALLANAGTERKVSDILLFNCEIYRECYSNIAPKKCQPHFLKSAFCPIGAVSDRAI